MSYSLEEIYLAAGREDITALVYFRNGSAAKRLYGDFICVEFVYTQRERETLDKAVEEQKSTTGCVKARYLGLDLDKELQEQLLKDGICSDEILKIETYFPPQSNTYHSDETRSIRKITIPIRELPKGGDYNWIYGFNRHRRELGIAFNPRDESFFLALKYYFEPDELTEEELNFMMIEGTKLNEDIELEYLIILYHRDELTPPLPRRYSELMLKRLESRRLVLDKHLKSSGSSWKKLLRENPEQADFLKLYVNCFRDKTLSVMGSPPIYLDLDGMLHVYMRHVEEFQVNQHFEHKDNFQWNFDDVMMVMEKIVRKHESEIQKALNDNPGQRYSRYGGQSIYFEGDYYTFHIEADGRVSTFHKNRKEKV